MEVCVPWTLGVIAYLAINVILVGLIFYLFIYLFIFYLL